ncbi:hypothetical protein V6N13_084657 [Hibiscus sabdariffa]
MHGSWTGGVAFRVAAGEEGDRKNIKWEMHESCTDEEKLSALTLVVNRGLPSPLEEATFFNSGRWSWTLVSLGSYLVRTREASEKTCKDSHGKSGFCLQKSERLNSVLCFCKRKAVGVFAMLLENHFAGGLLYISRVVAGEEGDRKNIKWEMHESCTDEETLRFGFIFLPLFGAFQERKLCEVLIRGQQVKLKISNKKIDLDMIL